MTSRRNPACLIVMDGFGLAPASPGNAIAQAKTPCLDALFARHPWVALEASGKAVGLPAGQMGNSEVGHLNIGAGRVVAQELTRIDQACEEGLLAENPVITQAFEQAKAKRSVLHLLGLLSDGGVHSSNQHLYALLRYACACGVPEVRVHCFMDGRDVPPKSGLVYLAELEERIAALGGGATHIAIASMAGRYFAMDRDNRWERVEAAYHNMVMGRVGTDLCAADALQRSYDAGISDEFVEPVCFDARGIADGDMLLFFNFRPDR
ncbi:MAG: 2,3-bisphosphoglycerate-independent phosphoglycerate mutase, partial [Coriobacteriaceae bacterium]|nr:2,3-bisphosphoglycerate-independent phosphoglycerate mutase [Coriobacteriaceae bacterium]